MGLCLFLRWQSMIYLKDAYVKVIADEPEVTIPIRVSALVNISSIKPCSRELQRRC